MDEDQIEDVDQSTQESFSVEDNSPEEPKINPAWQETLDKIPEEFHPALTPTFSEWDKNFQDVQQKYAPYKDFVEHNIPVERIQQAMQIADLFESNPRGVYDFLNTTYNFGGQVAEKPGPNEDDADSYNFDENGDIEKHPKFQEMAQKLEGFESWIAQNQQKEAEQRVQQEIQSNFSQISQKYLGGKEVDQQTQMDIARLAMGAGDNDLIKAADDYFTRFRSQPRVSDSAPPMLKGAGRVPNNSVSLEDIAGMNSEDRVKHVAALMRGIVEQE